MKFSGATWALLGSLVLSVILVGTGFYGAASQEKLFLPLGEGIEAGLSQRTLPADAEEMIDELIKLRASSTI